MLSEILLNYFAKSMSAWKIKNYCELKIFNGCFSTLWNRYLLKAANIRRNLWTFCSIAFCDSAFSSRIKLMPLFRRCDILAPTLNPILQRIFVGKKTLNWFWRANQPIMIFFFVVENETECISCSRTHLSTCWYNFWAVHTTHDKDGAEQINNAHSDLPK